MPMLSNILQSGSLAYQDASPASVAARRKLAQQLLEGSRVQNAGPFGALANALGGSFSGYENRQAGEQEAAGVEGYNSMIAKALQNPDMPDADLAGLASNPWAGESNNPIAAALMGQAIQRRDPSYQLDMDYKRAQLNDLQNPKSTQQSLMNIGDGVVFDPNTREWITQPTPEGGAAVAMDPDMIKAEGTLRTEYGNTNTVKDFGLQTQAYQRVLDSATNPSPAGDMALLYAYMKMLDPGSVVRETEFATAASSGSFGERIKAGVDQILNGTRLTDVQRKDFLERAGQIYQGASELQGDTNERYSGLAQEYGFDPERIVAPIPSIGILDPEFDVSEYLDPQTGQQWKPIPLTEAGADAEYEALPPGTLFMGPDGQVRRKP